MSSVIVINKMFSGSYLNDNLGHEVINLYKCDNGKYYLYLNHNGKFSKKYKTDKKGNSPIKEMLLVERVDTNTLRVIAKATGLSYIFNPINSPIKELTSQLEYIFTNDIKYGGTFLNNIFFGNEYQYVYLTFEAEDVKFVKSDVQITISFDSNYISNNPNEIVVHVNDYKGVRLREYFDSNKQPEDYQNLAQIINNDSLWGNSAGNVGKIDPKQVMLGLFQHRIEKNKHLNNYFKK